jgi:NAD(P)-dependent dehydrogenase (short-subunit alcohol dehydrogenase family)
MSDKGVFLVTGGSRGIGAAIARRAAKAGYTVLISYVSRPDDALSVVEQITAAGGTADAFRADTSRPEAVEALFARADEMGRLAVLVYNAGITGTSSRIDQSTPANMARVIDVNLTGALYCARAAVLRLSRTHGGDGGSIIFISSRATGYGSPAEHVWYAASKGGIDTLNLGLSRELGGEGIRVNAVSPGPIGTEMLSEEKKQRAIGVTPLQRVGDPDEVAAAVMYLASDEASFVTGANIAVSGGR